VKECEDPFNVISVAPGDVQDCLLVEGDRHPCSQGLGAGREARARSEDRRAVASAGVSGGVRGAEGWRLRDRECGGKGAGGERDEAREGYGGFGGEGWQVSYEHFVASKLDVVPPTGIANPRVDESALFPHQAALSTYALRRGRCAVLAHLGLGKTRIGLTYARHVVEHTNKPVLILTPLCVAPQMRDEAEKMGIEATVVREASDVDRRGINIINYERIHKLDTSIFGGVVPDESSCIKGLGSVTLDRLLDAFGHCAFRLALTATPAPNDFAELGQHCELLSICSRMEMLAEYFVHDGGDTAKWRLKGYGRAAFWKFVASWGPMVRSPADLGFDASAYELPPLKHHTHVLRAGDEARAGQLFATAAKTLNERRSAKRASLEQRVAKAADLANGNGEQWLVFCELNQESEALTRAIDGAIELTGSMPLEAKEEAVQAFLSGEARVLVSKPKLCGHGLNLQRCRNLVFASVSDSWEQRFQAIGRIHRFGQRLPCHVHSILSELEMAVLKNIERKQAEADEMARELAAECAEHVRESVLGQKRRVNDYTARKVAVPEWMVGA